MKRIITLGFVFFAVFYMGLQAQSFQFYMNNGGNPFPVEDTIYLEVNAESLNPNTGTLKTYIDIKNLTSNNYSVKIKGEQITNFNDNVFSYCYGECVVPPAETPAFDLTANELDHGFYCEFLPSGQKGIFYAYLTVFNTQNGSEKRSVVLKYNYGVVDIKEQPIHRYSLDAYPNPASNKIAINYSLDKNTSNTYVVVRDMVGKVIKQIKLNDEYGKLVLNTQEYSNGVYVYSLVSNGQTLSTKKFVVKK